MAEAREDFREDTAVTVETMDGARYAACVVSEPQGIGDDGSIAVTMVISEVPYEQAGATTTQVGIAGRDQINVEGGREFRRPR